MILRCQIWRARRRAKLLSRYDAKSRIVARISGEFDVGFFEDGKEVKAQ